MGILPSVVIDFLNQIHKESHPKMPREVNNSGTNSQGNSYTSYSDGAYRYTNSNSGGQTSGRYFNDGHGHGFYKSANQPTGNYSFHQNPSEKDLTLLLDLATTAAL